MNIPKIIHQTWKNAVIPEHLNDYVQSWKTLHPEWEYILWTDEMNRDFINLNFPKFLKVYDNYPTAIQKVDAVRYFILEKMGGLFVDLDFECKKYIAPLLENASFVAGLEPTEHAQTHKKEYIISNAFMAGISGHKFLHWICHALERNDYMKYREEQGFNLILDCAGPFMLSRLYSNFDQKELIKIVSHEFLYPLVKNEQSGKPDLYEHQHTQHIGDAYAIHHYWGSWWNH
jgi:mannosyltransferase OCH1-like enzyme